MSFQSSVRLLCYPRSLGRDAVPTDGSTVALGLGRTPVEEQQPLAAQGMQSDQISWMDLEMRGGLE